MINQPTSTALVETHSPGRKEFSGGSQHSVLLLTAGSSFVIGETLSGGHMENLTFRMECHGVNQSSSTHDLLDKNGFLNWHYKVQEHSEFVDFCQL